MYEIGMHSTIAYYDPLLTLLFLLVLKHRSYNGHKRPTNQTCSVEQNDRIRWSPPGENFSKCRLGTRLSSTSYHSFFCIFCSSSLALFYCTVCIYSKWYYYRLSTSSSLSLTLLHLDAAVHQLHPRVGTKNQPEINDRHRRTELTPLLLLGLSNVANGMDGWTDGIKRFVGFAGRWWINQIQERIGFYDSFSLHFFDLCVLFFPTVISRLDCDRHPQLYLYIICVYIL